MTTHKHLKQLVRARMEKTGESYATARRHVIRHAESFAPLLDKNALGHFPGNVPATTALRFLLTQAGAKGPQTGEAFSEAMIFGIAGGIGIGCFSFFYEKDDFASFFLAGRNSWQDDLSYLVGACRQFGMEPTVQESSGVKTAEKQLRETLQHGPCVAWIDAALLPHRAMPAKWSGGGYHVVTVYRLEEGDTALIGDLTDEPIRISLADLSASRQRIKKQKNRLLSLPGKPQPADLSRLVREGLRICHAGLTTQRLPNFKLESIRMWGERLHGGKEKESWERVFAPGHRAWNGLVSTYDFIEHYGTGGGLCRPLFAEFLDEAASALGNKNLRELSHHYADLGRVWTELAQAALPDSVPACRKAKELLAQKAELIAAGAAPDEIRVIWHRLDELDLAVREEFPLSASDYDALRAELQARVRAIFAAETAGCAAIENCGNAPL